MFDFAVEKLAQLLHEAGREAVARGLVVRTDVPVRPFVEWPDLAEFAREGRRVQARYLIDHGNINGGGEAPYRTLALSLYFAETAPRPFDGYAPQPPQTMTPTPEPPTA
jgi:hypothetical protein